MAESLHLVRDQWIQYKLGKQYLLNEEKLWDLPECVEEGEGGDPGSRLLAGSQAGQALPGKRLDARIEDEDDWMSRRLLQLGELAAGRQHRGADAWGVQQL